MEVKTSMVLALGPSKCQFGIYAADGCRRLCDPGYPSSGIHITFTTPNITLQVHACSSTHTYTTNGITSTIAVFHVGDQARDNVDSKSRVS